MSSRGRGNAAVIDDQKVVWHDGGGPGINAHLAHYPDLDLGIAILSNAHRVTATELGMSLSAMLVALPLG